MTTAETTVAAAEITAGQILDDLLKFVNRRTGMDVRNYAQDWRDSEGLKAFRSEYREILRDGRDARIMIRACRYLVPVEILLEEARTGRLTYGPDGFEYCVGQYWCTEYRAAACWYLRRCYLRYLMIADPILRLNGCTFPEAIERARGDFNRGIGRRWFS